MDLAVYLVGAVGFFALIMVSIALHEIGHLIPAKLFGVKTTQYFVGFGPTLWSRRRGETEYGVKALPLGGYVRMIGMMPPGKGGALRSSNTGIISSVVENARAADADDVTPADEGRLFYQKPPWQKLIIMVGGPLMNVVLAFGLLLSVNLAYGQPTPQLTIAVVNECVVPIARQAEPCRAGDPPTPAYQAGLRAGDTLVAFNGTPVRDTAQAGELIRANGDRTATLTVLRDGQQQQFDVTTVVTAVVGDDGRTAVQAGFLGVTWDAPLRPVGPVGTLQNMGEMTGQVYGLLLRFPIRVYEVAADLITGQPRDINGPMSVLGASRVAGEIASTDQIDNGAKIAGFVSTLGAVNLFVALFNFVPLLPLDGGHILGALWEWLRRGVARLTNRPRPGPFDVARLMPVAYVVTAVIALSGVVLILADIIAPITIF